MGPALQISLPADDGAVVPGGRPGSQAGLPPQPVDPQELADTDEWLRLEAELTPLASKFKRRDELRTKILQRFPDLKPDRGQTVTGTEANIWISEQDNKRVITDPGKRALHKLWGLRLFRKNARFTLSQLPDPDDKAGLFTIQEKTGPRHLKALPRLKSAA